MRLAVTGAHGFVGSNVTKTLAQQGHSVIAISRSKPDDWITRFLDGAGEVQHVVADLSIPGQLVDTLRERQLDAMVHAAVVTATTLSVERDDASTIVHVNAGGTIDALEAAFATGARRFVYVSSPSAIGHGVGSDELVEKRPESLYGITKDFSEEVVRRYGLLHNLSVASVRIAQPYGPGERATSSRVRTSPIWEWILDAEAGRILPTGPLDRTRDWTYIDDTAAGIATLATSPTLEHDLYHLAYGKRVSVGEVVDQLHSEYPSVQYTESPPASALNPNISGDSRRAPLDTTRFRSEFGWTPETGIVDGMCAYLSWWGRFRP